MMVTTTWTAMGTCSPLIQTRSYVQSSTRISLGSAEKLHQTQTAIFVATNTQEIRGMYDTGMNPFLPFSSKKNNKILFVMLKNRKEKSIKTSWYPLLSLQLLQNENKTVRQNQADMGVRMLIPSSLVPNKVNIQTYCYEFWPVRRAIGQVARIATASPTGTDNSVVTLLELPPRS